MIIEKEINDLKMKMQLVLENLHIKCRFYQGDEEPCLRDENNDPNWGSHVTCNCDGDLNKCDYKSFSAR